MEKYLTIGELAALSGSSIRCLRYYDELGILKPAYINGHTGYRYYTMEQLTVLSMIQVCNELDIPLKQFQDYRETDGTFALDKLVCTGEATAREKMRQLRQLTQKLEALSSYLADIRKAKEHSGTYDRSIATRSFALLPFQGNPNREDARMKALAELYRILSSSKVTVLYQQGLLFCRNDGRNTRIDCVIEIIHDSPCPTEVLVIPSGTYRCRLFRADRTEQVYANAAAQTAPQANAVLLLDYLDERQQRYTEVQEIPGTPRENRRIQP